MIAMPKCQIHRVRRNIDELGLPMMDALWVSKKDAPFGTPLSSQRLRQLDCADVACLLLTVLTAGDVKLNSSTLIEGLEAITLDLREVDEQIVSTFLRDETIALIRVEPLYCTFRQLKPVSPPRRVTTHEASRQPSL
jgi:hypothetical protein